jgi:hypothetical protein
MHAHSSYSGAQLVLGTDPFSAGALPVGGGLPISVSVRLG